MSGLLLSNFTLNVNYATTLAEGKLNACAVFVNGSAPSGMLEHELSYGDTIKFVYGFCGG